MFHFYFYVPEDALEVVKAAVFKAGAGQIGHYQECCWQSNGVGQYRPLEGSTPYRGIADALSQVPEVKVEMVCAKEHKFAVRAALLEAHPYEEVAYGFISIEN